MARIRSVHPGLASDEAFMSMSMAAKAAWALLWTECDDHGLFEWKPIVLKARIFPADAVDFAAVLAEYEALDCVKRVEIDGKTYGLIRNFCKYQRPKNPSYRYQWSDDFASYAGVSVVLPQPSPTATEKSPQRKEEGGRMKLEKEETADAVSAPARGEFEMACRKMVGEEPVLIALDFHSLENLVGGGEVTRDDVYAGIRAAMAKPDFRPRRWGQFEGWARRAAQDRMAGKAKGSAAPAGPSKPMVWIPQGSDAYEAWKAYKPNAVKALLQERGGVMGIFMWSERPPATGAAA